MSSELKVDTISEKTSANGVTIDSVSLKDGAVVGAELTDYVETDVAITSGTTLSIDLANGNTGSVTLGHNVTDIDFTNVPTDGTSSFTLKVTQDSTGSRTMAINAITVNGGSDVTAKTPGAAGLTLSTGASDIDLLTFLFFDAGTPLLNSLLDFS
jgi:uncharacterized RmlC-like cupin family protein